MEREQRLIDAFLGSARASRAGDRALAVANFRWIELAMTTLGSKVQPYGVLVQSLAT